MKDVEDFEYQLDCEMELFGRPGGEKVVLRKEKPGK